MADNWKKILAVVIGAVIACWFIDDFDPESVKGKRVLVTGASTGIGEQIAYQYCRLGADVIVTARRQHVLEKVVSRCRELGRQDGVYGYVIADMANLDDTKSVIQKSVDQLGGLDVLVLNHIMIHPLARWTGSDSDLDYLRSILDINVRSYIHLTSAATPWLNTTGGHVVVMSSLAGKVGVPFVAAYSASKFALFGFFSSLRNEFLMEDHPPPFSITLCTIGLVGTENALYHLRKFGSQSLLDTIKPADPADVAATIVKGGELRHREVFVPYLETKPFVLIKDWFPELVNVILRYVNRRSPDT